jgi:hypothetical protein
MKPLIHFKQMPRLIILALISCGISSVARAVVPPPDGCYPSFTTAEGCGVLNSLITGSGNTGLGWRALFADSTGSFNTGVGAGALVLNNGDSNTALGTAALLLNTTGERNTAVGAAALVFNGTGNANTANGAFALYNNTSGERNTAIGADALKANTTGGSNTANGDEALFSNTTGSENTATGDDALFGNTEGGSNTANGRNALFSVSTGSANTALGFAAGFFATTGNGNVYIGSGMSGIAGESNHTYIRNINTTSVSGGGTDYVTINLTTGLLGHLSSSRRHKEDIQPMTDASETLYRLKPVTYRYKKEIDATQSLDYGLVAEEVAAVEPNLVACDKDGQIETVRYTAVNAMLLNEFLKARRQIDAQQKQIEALSAGLQKVTAQLGATNGAAAMRSDIDGSTREADTSGSELVNAPLADSSE